MLHLWAGCLHVAIRRPIFNGSNSQPNPIQFEGSIMIIALPMIACMMSYRSVTRMWMICCNSHWADYHLSARLGEGKYHRNQQKNCDMFFSKMEINKQLLKNT
jgi:hypothetical protein